MGDRILIGYDRSRESVDALALAALIAETVDADLVIGTVVEHVPVLGDGKKHTQALAAKSAPILTQAQRELSELGAEAEVCAAGREPAGPGLAGLAAEHHCGLIAIGSSRKGPLGRLYPGSTADELIHGASVPFAVPPRGYAGDLDRDLRLIGLAYDGSNGSKRAAEVAVGLARAACTGLRVFGVREPMTSPLAPGVALPGADVHAQLEEDVDRLIDELPPSVGGQKVMLDGDAGQALVDQGRFASDAMVVGSHGFGRILRFMAGSVASSVVRAAPWPVFVVPEHGRLPFANAGRPL